MKKTLLIYKIGSKNLKNKILIKFQLRITIKTINYDTN